MCNKQLLDDVFVISRIIKIKVSVTSQSQVLRLITLTETLIISDITETESNNCYINIVLWKIAPDALMHRTQFIIDNPCSYFIVLEVDIALGNQALHAQPTD